MLYIYYHLFWNIVNTILSAVTRVRQSKHNNVFGTSYVWQYSRGILLSLIDVCDTRQKAIFVIVLSSELVLLLYLLSAKSKSVTNKTHWWYLINMILFVCHLIYKLTFESDMLQEDYKNTLHVYRTCDVQMNLEIQKWHFVYKAYKNALSDLWCTMNMEIQKWHYI